MSTQTQIKITISDELKDFLKSKASRLGIPMSAYIRHLIIKDVEDEEYPTYQASEETIKAYKKAIKEHKEGKSIKVDDIEEFFDKL